MYGNKLGFELMLNIGLLLIVGSLLAKVRLVQNMLLEESRDWRRQLILSLLFASIIILSTYTSIDIGGYKINTRVIGALGAGLL